MDLLEEFKECWSGLGLGGLVYTSVNYPFKYPHYVSSFHEKTRLTQGYAGRKVTHSGSNLVQNECLICAFNCYLNGSSNLVQVKLLVS